MSKNKENKTVELNDKNKETQNIFNNLRQYKKKDKTNIEEDIENTEVNDTDSDIDNSDNIYMALLDNNTVKNEYINATHYFRKDQLKDIEIFSKKTNKLKSEFMRELIDLVFSELKRGLDENKGKHVVTDGTINNSNVVDKAAPSDSPFGSLLEANDSKEQYIRATHSFREDQLEDLDKFVDKSGKSKNEFVRDAIDLVFVQLKEMND